MKKYFLGLCILLAACSGSNAVVDQDLDAVADVNDNCPGIANADQADVDSDGVGDACDDSTDCPNELDSDADEDCVDDADDICPEFFNPEQSEDHVCSDCPEEVVDADGDCVADESDNCPTDYNPNQEDVDEDLYGDACESAQCVNDANCVGIN